MHGREVRLRGRVVEKGTPDGEMSDQTQAECSLMLESGGFQIPEFCGFGNTNTSFNS